jgi:hypothetical protein
MLDAFIIEQIKQEELEREQEQPSLELPLGYYEPMDIEASPAPVEERGVCIIEF